VPSAELSKAGAELGMQIYAASSVPNLKTHAVRAARIAIMHTWYSTQGEGWWRVEFDRLKIPYDYISTQTASNAGDLRSKYDVIVFPPGVRNPQTVINGMPMYGNPLPWKVTALTPNLGKTDETDDMRPGLGWTGLERRPVDHRERQRQLRRRVRTYARRFHLGGATAQSHRFGFAIEDGGRGQPDCLWVQGQSRDLRLESSGF
jgi:hypothetical protein